LIRIRRTDGVQLTVYKITLNSEIEHFLTAVNKSKFQDSFTCLKTLAFFITGKLPPDISSICIEENHQSRYELFYSCLNYVTSNTIELLTINKYLHSVKDQYTSNEYYYLTSLSRDLVLKYSSCGMFTPNFVDSLFLFFKETNKDIEDILCSRLISWTSFNNLQFDWSLSLLLEEEGEVGKSEENDIYETIYF